MTENFPLNLKGSFGEIITPVAFVTGGSRGIGKAIVLALVRAGVKTAFTFKSDEKGASEVSHEARKLGGETSSFQADVRDFKQAQKISEEVCKNFGAPVILVNNAGIAQDRVIWKMEESQWDEVVDTNLKGCFNYTQAFASKFKEQKKGKIINITSINGMRGKFGQSNYSASKAGMIGFTKSIARELGAYNINVNAVAPGLIATEMEKALPKEISEKALSETLLGRLGTPEDVAGAVLFLCSPLAKHITGHIIQVDGGQYL